MTYMRAFILKCASPEGQKLGCLDGLCFTCHGYDLKVNLLAAALTDIGEYAIVDKDNMQLLIPPYFSISSGEFIDKGMISFPENMRESIFNSICESLAKLTNLDSYTSDERHILNDIIYFLWQGMERRLDVTSRLDEKLKESEMGDFWQAIKDENQRALVRYETHQRLKARQKRLAPEIRAEKKRMVAEKHRLRKLESIKRKPLYVHLNHIKKADFLSQKTEKLLI